MSKFAFSTKGIRKLTPEEVVRLMEERSEDKKQGLGHFHKATVSPKSSQISGIDGMAGIEIMKPKEMLLTEDGRWLGIYPRNVRKGEKLVRPISVVEFPETVVGKLFDIKPQNG